MAKNHFTICVAWGKNNRGFWKIESGKSKDAPPLTHEVMLRELAYAMRCVRKIMASTKKDAARQARRSAKK